MILAIETSLKNGSISILNEGNQIGFRLISEADSMSQQLLSEIDKLLLENGLRKTDLKLIALSNGPGSLTGIRVGISVGIGLAFALGIKCVGVSLLEAMTLLIDQASVVSIAPAGRIQSYWQYFGIENKSPINLIENEKIPELLREYRWTSFVVEKTLSELFYTPYFKNDITVCPANLSQLVGKKALEITKAESFPKPFPIYPQETNFKTVI